MISLKHCQSDVGGHYPPGVAKSLGPEIIHKPFLFQCLNTFIHNILQWYVGVHWGLGTKVSDADSEVVPPVFPQVYVPVNRLEISDGGVR